MLLALAQAVDPAKPGSTWDSLTQSLGNPALYAKLLVLALLSPFWWPVLKAMYHEVNATLRGEGGLFGRTPTARELERLDERYVDHESPLVSTPKLRPGERSRRVGPSAPTRSDGAPRVGGGRTSGLRSDRRRGF